MSKKEEKDKGRVKKEDRGKGRVYGGGVAFTGNIQTFGGGDFSKNRLVTFLKFPYLHTIFIIRISISVQNPKKDFVHF